MRHIIASLSHRAKVSQAIKRAILAAGLAALAGCTLSANQETAATTAVTAAAAVVGTINPAIATDGMLFCQYGPTIAAIAKYNLTGQTAAAVAAVCKAWNPVAAPVPVPTVPTVPVVSVPTA